MKVTESQSAQHGAVKSSFMRPALPWLCTSLLLGWQPRPSVALGVEPGAVASLSNLLPRRGRRTQQKLISGPALAAECDAIVLARRAHGEAAARRPRARSGPCRCGSGHCCMRPSQHCCPIAWPAGSRRLAAGLLRRGGGRWRRRDDVCAEDVVDGAVPSARAAVSGRAWSRVIARDAVNERSARRSKIINLNLHHIRAEGDN